MERKVVVYDIDEVLSDTAETFRRWHDMTYGTDTSGSDTYDFDSWERAGVSKLQLVARFKEFMHTSDMSQDIPVVEGSKAGVERLSKFYDGVSVTSRLVDLRVQTKDWIERNFPEKIDPVYFASHYQYGRLVERKKSEVIRENVGLDRVVAVIEDGLSFALDIAESGLPVVLLARPWNADPELKKNYGLDNLPEGIYRAYDWPEVVEKLLSSNGSKATL